jgi:hypothetical protein
MKMLFLLPISVFFLTQTSLAENFSCENPIVLRKLVKECNQNFAYSNAAKKCISNFETAVTAARKNLDLILSKISKSEKQSAGLANAKTAYEKAVATLLNLSDRGKILSKQIALYKNEVVLPEDFANIGDTGFSANVFLDNNPCYKDSQDLLSTYEKIMESLSEEVRLTAEISRKMQEKSFSGEQNLENNLPAPTAQEQKNGSETVPNAPKGKTPRTSDISGTEKTKKEGEK